MHVVDKSDHLMNVDNPDELVRIIVGDLKGEITHIFETKLVCKLPKFN